MHDGPLPGPAVGATPDAPPVPNELQPTGDPNADAAFDALGQPLPARAFAASLGEEAREYGAPRPQPRTCPWCNEPLAGDAETRCRSCGAALKPVDDELQVPGVTLSPMDLRASQEAAAQAVEALRRGDQAAAGLEPPSAAVRHAMLELELEALKAEEHAAEGRAEPDEPGS